jgi:pimeloyl-ACP methyl ester carboxylesterase
MPDMQIRYARTEDGVSIAYTVMGEGVPLVYTSNVMGDIHWYTYNDGTRRQIDTLVDAGCRVVRYDLRGMGSSDRDVRDYSVQARVLDLEAVVEAAGIGQFALCGYAHGSAVAISYAAGHPDRVTHLVLVNPYANGADYYQKVPPAGAMIELRATAERDWNFYTLTLASAMAAHDDPAAARRTAELFRAAVAPSTYLAFADEARATVVTQALQRVSVPTLVLIDPSPSTHPDLAKAVAAPIRDARLAVTSDYITDLLMFLGLEPPLRREAAPGQKADAGTVIILFADIADSTALTERLGDAGFRERSRALDQELRAAVSAQGGAVVDAKTLGDGILATFPAASQAIAAALAAARRQRCAACRCTLVCMLAM